MAAPPSAATERALRELRRLIPKRQLLLEPAALAAYAGDASSAQPVRPLAVVRAGSVVQIQETLRWASEHRIPVTPRGAGTGKAGGSVPCGGGIVLSLEALNSIERVCPDHGFAEVQAGVITGPFRDEMAADHGLFYPPDPNSLQECTLGGNAATNAGGPVALKYGVTGNFVMGLNAVLADGTAIELGRRQPKGVAGYDLSGLLVGSEGTLAVITGLRLALLPEPRERITALVAFSSVSDAAAAVASSRRAGQQPRALELVDGVTLRRIRPHADFDVDPRWGAILLVEFDGPPGQPAAELERFLDALPAPGAISVERAQDPASRAALWETRRAMSKLVKIGTVGHISEDIAVPIGSIPALCAQLQPIAERHRLIVASYGHAGDGNLHVNVLWEDEDGAERAQAAAEQVFRATLALGGTITGEHGVGSLKRPYLPWEQAPSVLRLQRALKAQWDPLGILNPGKVV